MNKKSILILVLFVFWLLLCSYYYMCKIRGICFLTDVTAPIEKQSTDLLAIDSNDSLFSDSTANYWSGDSSDFNTTKNDSGFGKSISLDNLIKGRAFQTIRFEDQSVSAIMSEQELEQLSNLVADMLLVKNSQVHVVGYSSELETADANFQMGRKRAWVIKKMIWNMGLDPNRIKTHSMGNKAAGSGIDSRHQLELITIYKVAP